MALRYIGSVVRPYESHGRLLVGDVPPYVADLPIGTTLHIGYSPSFARPFVLRSSGRNAHGLIFELDSLTTPEAVRELKSMGVFADEDLLRSLGNVKYFSDELIGCAVFNNDTGESIGTIVDIWNMPASDVWVMDYQGSEIPIPAVEEYIRNVDVANRRVEIYVMPGLLELAENSENDERDDE